MPANNPIFMPLPPQAAQLCLTCHGAGELLQVTVSFPVPAIVESSPDPGTQLLVAWEELKQGRRVKGREGMMEILAPG